MGEVGRPRGHALATNLTKATVKDRSLNNVLTLDQGSLSCTYKKTTGAKIKPPFYWGNKVSRNPRKHPRPGEDEKPGTNLGTRKSAGNYLPSYTCILSPLQIFLAMHPFIQQIFILCTCPNITFPCSRVPTKTELQFEILRCLIGPAWGSSTGLLLPTKGVGVSDLFFHQRILPSL